MRQSQLFGKTRKDTSGDEHSKNAQLLAQAGFIDKVSAGVYSYLPLGLRVLHKIIKIVRSEMNAIGGQEILMPSMHPLEYWEKTGRIKTMDDILFRTGKNGNVILGPSHEETVTPLAKKYIHSYKDLPVSLYQIQTKFRDEPRAKSGLLRGREFGMKDMYSFHTSQEDLEMYYARAIEAYLNIYSRCGLEAFVIQASGGAFSDDYSHEFAIKTEAGEDVMIYCNNCKFAQNLEIAEGKYDNPSSDEVEQPWAKVKVKRGKSVKENAQAHRVDEWRILKTVVYMVEDTGPVGVLIRGDFSINEHKLERYFHKPVRSSSSEELKELGLVEGFISPVNEDGGRNEIIEFVADESIRNMKNFVTGANKENMDVMNINIGRDFEVKDFADFVEIDTSFMCPQCGHQLEEAKAVEAGNIFKLGTKYTDVFDVQVTDKDGKKIPVIMGCYGFGTTRLLGTVVEASHDENGIIWPKSIAPYTVHLVQLGNDDEVATIAEKLYENFRSKCIDVLYDDRDTSAGDKFNDSDLIGIPLRLVVSKRSLEKNSTEWKERSKKDSEMVKIDDVVKRVQEFVA